MTMLSSLYCGAFPKNILQNIDFISFQKASKLRLFDRKYFITSNQTKSSVNAHRKITAKFTSSLGKLTSFSHSISVSELSFLFLRGSKRPSRAYEHRKVKSEKEKNCPVSVASESSCCAVAKYNARKQSVGKENLNCVKCLICQTNLHLKSEEKAEKYDGKICVI